MQEKSGETLTWRDLSADEVYHIAHIENEIIDLADGSFKTLRARFLENQEMRSQEWFIDQSIARQKKPEIPELKDMPRVWLSSMLKANITSRAILSEASGVSTGSVSSYITGNKRITDQARARLESGFNKLKNS